MCHGKGLPGLEQSRVGKAFRDLAEPGSYDFPARGSLEYTVHESREKRATSREYSSSSYPLVHASWEIQRVTLRLTVLDQL